jgi:hypothetical protein
MIVLMKNLIVPFLIIIAVIIYDYAYYIPDCLEKSGEYPVVGLCGLVIISAFLLFDYQLHKTINRIKSWVEILLLVAPFLSFFLYCGCFYCYVEYDECIYLKNSHVRVGEVYDIYTPLRRGAHCVEIKVGIDKNHTRVYRIDEYSELASSIYGGKLVILRVSDEYPRVNEVLEWNPTYDEIERYKVPRKFKSYVNGKIEEEEE